MMDEKNFPLPDGEATHYNWDKFKAPTAHQEQLPTDPSSGEEPEKEDLLSASGVELKRQKEEAQKAADAARIEEIHRAIQEELDKPDNDGKDDGMKEAA